MAQKVTFFSPSMPSFSKLAPFGWRSIWFDSAAKAISSHGC